MAIINESFHFCSKPVLVETSAKASIVQRNLSMTKRLARSALDICQNLQSALVGINAYHRALAEDCVTTKSMPLVDGICYSERNKQSDSDIVHGIGTSLTNRQMVHAVQSTPTQKVM